MEGLALFAGDQVQRRGRPVAGGDDRLRLAAG